MGDAEELARLCVEARARLSQAGRALHDDAGGLLAAAGLRLQMLEDDYPAVAARLREVSVILEQAIQSVKNLWRGCWRIQSYLWRRHQLDA